MEEMEYPLVRKSSDNRTLRAYMWSCE